MDPLSLTGRVALVTGTGRRIGAAIAAGFAAAGARVVTLDTRSAATGVANVIACYGRIDVLVNTPDEVPEALLEQVDDADWRAALDANLSAAMACARAIVPHMKAARWGRIVSVASQAARSGSVGQTAFAASTAGIVGMTRVWAVELGAHGITANAVAPGLIDTPALRELPELARERLLAPIPARRLGSPEDVANVCLLLASEQAGFINGAVVGAFGGLRL
jgi:3-oxoacyl-[acyl-carrier protein] reductase